MPRVHRKTKIRLGADRHCGACGKKIEPGEQYLTWSFRYGGSRYRCLEHPPRPSDLTQSKLSTVYAAIEDAEDQLPGAGSVEDIRGLVETVGESVREVAEEYQEASEPFGYQGENAERAEELEGWADELENFDPDEPEEEEFEETDHEEEAKERSDADEVSYSAAMQAIREEWEAEHEDDGSALEGAREEASELLGGCPL